MWKKHNCMFGIYIYIYIKAEKYRKSIIIIIIWKESKFSHVV